MADDQYNNAKDDDQDDEIDETVCGLYLVLPSS